MLSDDQLSKPWLAMHGGVPESPFPVLSPFTHGTEAAANYRSGRMTLTTNKALSIFQRFAFVVNNIYFVVVVSRRGDQSKYVVTLATCG